MRENKRAIIIGVLLAIWLTVKLSEWFNPTLGMVLGPILGIALGFAISKSITSDTAIVTNEGENIIHSGPANHIKKGVSVGGELYLLKDRLEFKTHNFNLSDEHLIINIQDIQNLEFYNNLGIIKNGLKVNTTDNRTEKFVVKNRQVWFNLIMNQKNII